jgi:hypothetical protein
MGEADFEKINGGYTAILSRFGNPLYERLCITVLLNIRHCLAARQSSNPPMP